MASSGAALRRARGHRENLPAKGEVFEAETLSRSDELRLLSGALPVEIADLMGLVDFF